MTDDTGKTVSATNTGSVSARDINGLVNTGVITGAVNIYQGGPPGQPAPIKTLPSLPGIFQPRLKELEEVKKLLNGAGSNVSAITAMRGWPGVGKTTLLIELAHDEQVRARFSDGLMWVSLGPNPDVDNLLLQCAERVGFNKNQLEGQARGVIKGAIHDYLVNKNFLIIIDDAWNSAHVNPFLFGGQNCATIMATRNRDVARAIAPKRLYSLDEMTPADGIALLAEVAPNVVELHRERCVALIHSLGLLPLTIKIAGGLLNDTFDRGFNVSEFIEKLIADSSTLLGKKLPDEDADDGEVPNVTMLINKSLARMDEKWHPLYSMLSVFGEKPINYDLLAIKTVWEVEDPEPMVGKLVDLGLLEPIGDGIGRYQMHALLVDHASHMPEFTPEESEKILHPAHIRHADHYRNILSALDGLYLKGGASMMQALWIYDNLEWPNIQRAQQWAERNWKKQDGSADLAVAEIVAGFPNAGVYILSLRLQSKEWIKWYESAFKGNEEIITVLSGDDKTKLIKRKGALLGNLGIAYHNLGDYPKAIECCEQALEISGEIGDRRWEGNALGNLGIAYFSLGDYRKAIEYYEQALKISGKIDDRRMEGNTLGSLGNAYNSLGDYRKAIGYYEQALKISGKIDDRRMEGNTLGGLGNAYDSLGDYPKAIEYHEKALEIAREIGNQQGEGNTCHNLAVALDNIGKTSEALEYAERAVVIHESTESSGAKGARKLRDYLKNKLSG